MPSLSLRTSCLALLLILTCTLASYLYADAWGAPWLGDVSLNLGTEIIGIFLTIGLIDAVIRGRDERERKRVRNLAIRSMRPALMDHLRLLQGMYKAAAPATIRRTSADVRELFDEEFFGQLRYLDFAAQAPVLPTQQWTWFDYLAHHVRQFRAGMVAATDRYATFLDGETLERIETLMSTSFLAFLEQASAIPAVDRKEGWKRSYALFSGTGMTSIVKDHADALLSVIDSCNGVLPSGDSVAVDIGHWRNDIAPVYGSARSEIAGSSTPLH